MSAGIRKWSMEEILAQQSVAGGWDMVGLKQLGVSWPPAKGWKYRLLAGMDPNDKGQSVPKSHSAYCGECMKKYEGPFASAELEEHIIGEPCTGYAKRNPIPTYILPNPKQSWFPEPELTALPCDDFASNVGSGKCGHCGHGLGSHRWKWNRCHAYIGGESACRRCGKGAPTHEDLPLRISRFFGKSDEEWL